MSNKKICSQPVPPAQPPHVYYFAGGWAGVAGWLQIAMGIKK